MRAPVAIRRSLVGVAVATFGFVVTAGPSLATPNVPYTDSDADAYLGICNQQGHQITSGNVDLGVVRQSVSVTGLLGSKRTVSLPKVTLLLPGASIPEQAVVPGVWPQLLAHEVVSAKPVVLATGEGPPAVTASASVWLWTIPWTLVLIVIVVAAAVYLYRRKRSRRSRTEADGDVTGSKKVLQPTGRAEVPA